MLSYGKNVLMMTDPKTIRKVYISKTRKDKELFDYLRLNKINYVLVDSNKIDKMAPGNNQGIAFERDEYKYHELSEALDEEFVVILDHIEDPHNFGAIIRSAEAAGVKSIIIPKDRGINVNDTVMKTSVGTTSNVKIIKVVNLANTIKTLQDNNFFVYASAMDGEDARKLDFSGKKVLIIGNEGNGVQRLLKEKSDFIVAIPMNGEVNSLNASVAAGILLFKMSGLI